VPPPEPSEEEPRSLAAEQPAASAFPPDDRTSIDFRDLSGYLLAALLASLVAVIGLQLRTARQLKQTRHEVDQIAHHPAPAQQQTPSTSIFSQQAEGTLEPKGISQASTTRSVSKQAQRAEGSQHAVVPVPPHADIARLPDLPVELSPLERAVLKAIYGHEEVQEGELRKTLENRGFPGVLIKAVIGDIMRRTGSDSPPWISVSYAQGRYTYRLQLHNVPGYTGEHKGG
jgi:hypothetical protein